MSDSVALSEATTRSSQVTTVFVFDSNILNKLKDKNDKRLSFISESLREIDENLRDLGSALVVLRGDPIVEIPKIAKKLNVDAVFTNHDYEPYAKQRDRKVRENLQCDFLTFKDQVIFEGSEVVNQSKEPYKVFTPYKKQWLKQLQPEDYEERKVEKRSFSRLKNINKVVSDWSLGDIGFESSHLWLKPGESAGRNRLSKFSSSVDAYHEQRDFPGVVNGTSGLSVHFRFGTVSIREAVRFALKHDSKGSDVWLSELIWREFYHMILDHFPHVEKHAFKEEYDNVDWPGENKFLNAWKKGETGYPIVDAAMRHFNETGWMHNRLRMVVASFLTKDLLVDWRKGEEYFARYLLDFDLAANNGGWQWSASTGCDAQPYFRIFNPILQSKRFDTEGEFIKFVLPELKGFKTKRIHFPAEADMVEQAEAGCTIGKDYPAPIVDHRQQKRKALALLGSVKK